MIEKVIMILVTLAMILMVGGTIALMVSKAVLAGCMVYSGLIVMLVTLYVLLVWL